MAGRAWRLHLTGAQEDIVLTVTPKDCIIHWLGTCPQNSNTRLVKEAITLPYQEGSALHNDNTPTEVISNYSKASLVPGWEAFMIRRPLPIPPTAPDVKSLDESESNISSNVPEYDGKSEGQRWAREKKEQTKRRSQTPCQATKKALTECSPRASCYLEQKVRGSWTLVVEKTKNLAT
jgi:hypothetical protein